MTDPQSVHWSFEQISDVAAELGESPLWCARENCVWWVDISGRRLLKTSLESTKTTSWPMPEETGFVVLAADGAVVVGMESGLYRFDPASASFTQLAALDDPRIRFNDAAIDDRGRLWATAMDIRNLEPIGVIYRIDPDLSLHIVETGLRTPNGLAADGALGRLYYSDSHKDVRTVWTVPFDPAGGTLGEKQVFARLDAPEGRPTAPPSTATAHTGSPASTGPAYMPSPRTERASPPSAPRSAIRPTSPSAARTSPPPS